MNDFERDCKEKKDIARSARKKPGMYLGTNCSLPSDHLTPKEIQQMSGPMASYQLGAPMSWEDFKKLPLDLMRLYLQNLQNKYGGTPSRVAAMFGISKKTVFQYSKTCRISWKNQKNNSESAKAWAAFIGEIQAEEMEEEHTAELRGMESITQEQEQPDNLQFSSGRLRISGPLENVLEALRRVLPEKVSIEIKFKQED